LSESNDPASIALRKNTVDVPGFAAREPDATLTCEDVSFENPAPDWSDHRTFEFGSDDEFEPIDSTHACVAFTFSERPWVDAPAFVALTAEAEADEKAATFTFTRGGTVTYTVCVRLVEDPACATAPREISALPTTIASNERSMTIYRASKYHGAYRPR
jgi:hypothetical protein